MPTPFLGRHVDNELCKRVLNGRSIRKSPGCPETGVLSGGNPAPEHYSSNALASCFGRAGRVVQTRARSVLSGICKSSAMSVFVLVWHILFRAVSDTKTFQSVSVQQTAAFQVPEPAAILQRSHRSCASSTIRVRIRTRSGRWGRSAELGDCAGGVPFADKTTTRVPTFTRL